MSRSFILAVRFVLICILLCLLAFAAKATAEELSPPQFVRCGMTDGEHTISHVCIMMTFVGKTFVVMFARDGRTVVMVMRIEEDGSRTIVYQQAEPLAT